MEITKRWFYFAFLLALLSGGLFMYLQEDVSENRERVIEHFFQTLRHNNSKDAFENYTSRAFKEATPFQEFQAYLNENRSLVHHQFEGIDGDVAYFESDGVPYRAHFTFVQEEGSPKIMTLELHAPEIALLEGAKIDKILVGTDVDDKGRISAAKSVLSSKSEAIFVNVFLNTPVKGEKVELYLTHVESGKEALPLSTSLREEGESMVSFSYVAPLGGWPKGEYQVEARLDSQSKSFRFTVD